MFRVLTEMYLFSLPADECAVRAAQVLVEVGRSPLQYKAVAAGHVWILEGQGIVTRTADADPFRRRPEALTLVQARDKLQLDHPIPPNTVDRGRRIRLLPPMPSTGCAILPQL